MAEEKGLTRGELVKRVGCPHYIIDYLKSLNKLPLISEPEGPGHHIRYAESSVEIIKGHLSRGKKIRGIDVDLSKY